MNLMSLFIGIYIILASEYVGVYSFSKVKHSGFPDEFKSPMTNLRAVGIQPPKSPLDDLIIKFLNEFKANMTYGFPDFGIPILDPLEIEFIPVNILDTMLSLNGTIRNLQVIGLSKFEVISVNSDLTEYTIDIKLSVPFLEISGEYALDGKVGDVLPLYGKGPFKINLTEIGLSAGCKLSTKPTGGMFLEELHYQIQLKQIQVKIDGLLGGGELSDSLNEIINIHGLNMLTIWENKIHDKLVDTLLVYINNLLQPVKWSGIMRGITLATHNYPKIISKSGIPITRADASEYLDYVLANLREYMIYNGLDRLPLDNKTVEFSETFLGIIWHGEAALYNGILTGLETIHRCGPANLNMENGGDIVFDAELEVNDAGLKYDMLAQFMGLGPSATVIGNLASIKVFIKCKVSSGLNNVTLDEFNVLDLGHLNIDVYGLGPLGFIASFLANIIGNSVKGLVADLLEGTIKSMLNEIIGNMIFPINNAIRFTKNINIHKYHRQFRSTKP